jgi:putative transposase
MVESNWVRSKEEALSRLSRKMPPKTFICLYVLGMTTDPESILSLYQQIVTVGLLQYLQKEAGMKVRRGIYSARVVLWLMILQRLHGGASLAAVVQLLIQGAAGPLLQSCHRVQRGSISARTGAYCQARQKLPKLLCRQVTEEIIEQLRQVLGREEQGPGNVFLLDGSSIELEHCRELMGCYPPAENQHGKSHWPVLRIVVAHDANTGMASCPYWGAMYGASAVSEQELAEKAMAHLPAGATVLGDRNFGVFWMAHAAQQRNLGLVLRLTEVRARKLVGIISQEGVHPVVWEASRWDGGKDHRCAAGATVTGRLIATRIGRGKSKEWLYLFSTLDLPVDEVVQLYSRRWNIETDLRSLKRTVRLHHINAKSDDMLEKELLMAMAAYNLVRAVMCMAARRSGLNPRQLSFAGVLNVVNYAWPKLLAAPTKQAHDREFIRVLDLAAQCTLPKRAKRRSYPRETWRRPTGFPFRKAEKTK